MRAKLTILLVTLPIFAWALYGVFGGRIASAVSAKYGAKLLVKGDGKFTDPVLFIKGILKDATVLMITACVLLLAYRMVVAVAERRLQAPAIWIVQGWTMFVCLNVLVGVAAQTALFWCFVYAGKDDMNNFTHWHIKESLMDESSVASQAILLGNSQTHVEIDARILNARLAGKVRTTELHFPGSSMYDTFLALERVRSRRVKYVISYVSESPFYGESSDYRLMYYFGFRDLPAYWKLGPGGPRFDRYLVGGLLGDIFPIYQTWEPLMGRLRGVNSQKKEQAKYDAALESNLDVRARRMAKQSEGADSSFQKRAFVLLAKLCRERGCRLVICEGQLNPILERLLNPSVRRDMLDFLSEQAAHDTNIVLLKASELPPQNESDYLDLTHVDDAAHIRFSEYMVGVLDKLEQPAAAAIHPSSSTAR